MENVAKGGSQQLQTQAWGCPPYPGRSIHCDAMFNQHIRHWNMAFLCYQVERSQSTLNRNRCASALNQQRIPVCSDRAGRLEFPKSVQPQLALWLVIW